MTASGPQSFSIAAPTTPPPTTPTFGFATVEPPGCRDEHSPRACSTITKRSILLEIRQRRMHAPCLAATRRGARSGSTRAGEIGEFAGLKWTHSFVLTDNTFQI